MNTADSLVRSIFQKETLYDCSLEELQTMAAQYPYFMPVQFLLAEKLRSADEHLYNVQLQKLSLYINNPLWLDFLLNDHKEEPMVIGENENKNSTETLQADEDRESTETQDTGVLNPFPENNEHVREDAPENINENETIAAEEINISEKQEYVEVSAEQTYANSEPADIPNETTETQNESLHVADNIIPPEKQEHSETNIEEFNDEPGIPTEKEEGDNEPPLSISFPGLNQEPEETKISFEPYHTVDYFASQGIKYVPEEKPADRFTQQLKSFTEWLKAMKKLPQAEVIKPDLPSEEKVVQLADHSITESDVATEAMAEVWLKQGNNEKAIEIYNKLSLLDPSKSAYFASLAEQLKNR